MVTSRICLTEYPKDGEVHKYSFRILAARKLERFVDMFALALSILRAARMRTAEKALRTGMLAMQAINLRSVFEREKEKKKRRSVRLRYWVVVVGKVRSHSCQGPAGFENEKDLGKQQRRRISLPCTYICFLVALGDISKETSVNTSEYGYSGL